MKVLFVCSGNVKYTDVVPFIKEQGESLKRIGISVDYYPVIGKGIPNYIKSGLKLRKYLKKNHYDLIHAHFIFSGWVAIIGSGKTPVVLSLMGSDAYGEYIGENKVQLKSRLNTLLTYLIQPFVRALISKSHNIEKYVYLKKKSYIIPNGINIEKFISTDQDFRVELGLDKNKQLILFLGNKANVRKNFSLAQKVVESLDSPQLQLINPFPVSHVDIPKYLNSVNVLIMPSLMEGSPNIIKEAMACNCPIVSTDVGDVKWLFGSIEGCFLASFDVKDFAEKVSQALIFSDKNHKTKGRQRIAELGLEAHSIADRIQAIYQKVLCYSEKDNAAYPKSTVNIESQPIT